MTNFKSLGLAEPILRALSAEGYDAPTPIQAGVIPTLLDGNDLVGIAQTGTGKTAAFVLPLLQKISELKSKPQHKTCRALVLAPTRELAAQIEDGIRTYGQFLKTTSTVIVGGAKAGPQVRAMARGIDILVATPGRLEDHMSTGAISLKDTTAVVLDEADQMLDLGFMPAVRRILAALPRKRQTALLSATMPKQIRSLADEFLNNPKEVAVAPQSKPIDRIKQTLVHVEKANKRQMLVDVLKRETIERAVVFARTKHGSNKLAQVLENNGLRADAIHGNKSQSQRVRTLEAFKSGKVPILVATDIAARGIDIDGVSHVINYDLPNVPEVFVHRIGRTARAGASGIAISICDETERDLLRDIEKLIKMQIEIDELSAEELVPAQAPEKRGSGGRNQRIGRKKPGTREPRRQRQRRKKTGGGEQTPAAGAAPKAAKEASNDNSHKPGQQRKRRPQKQQRNGGGEGGNQNREQRSARSNNKGGSNKTGSGKGGDSAGLSRMLGNIDRSQKAARKRA
ncbi:MAG: DEAD/DEAH box helicase [Alphaproteobacteria bacterium]|nr:DEAD/DEAH box helicase [Alphaproteobacteria bacterium]